MEILARIAQHPVFCSLEEWELESINSISEQMHFKEGEILFDIDQMPNFMFFVEAGSFILHFPNNDIAHYSTGDIVGEIGVISGDFRAGTVTATTDATVMRICGTRLFSEEFVSPSTALKVVRALSKRITHFLRSTFHVSTKELIDEGENDHVEFKSTLRYNLFTGKKDKDIEHAVLKTISAMLNSNGGMLLVGVDDDGKPIGLDADRFENNDKMLLHLSSMIKREIGSLHLKYIHSSIETVSEKAILRIDINPADRPAFCQEGNQEHFYIRTGPSTTSLPVSKAHQYIIDRFALQQEDKERAGRAGQQS